MSTFSKQWIVSAKGCAGLVVTELLYVTLCTCRNATVHVLGYV